MYHAKITGTGSYLPERRLTNADIEKLVDTSDEWIFERTGIRERRIAAEGEGNSDLAARAARNALEMAGLEPKDLDMIVFACVTPDQPIPTASCLLQNKLGCRTIPAFDIGAMCTGFVYGMGVAHQFIRTGEHKNILVVGSELLSRITNYKDRETCILFGDAAGAIILTRADESDLKTDILSSHLHAEGQLAELFDAKAGGTKIPITHEVLDAGTNWMKMKGREIFKHAVRTISKCCEEALEKNNLSVQDVDWFIPHQANIRIIEGVAKQLKMPLEKIVINIENVGNTSAATIPVAFDLAVRDGRIKRGQLVMFGAFGAGLTSGSILFRY